MRNGRGNARRVSLRLKKILSVFIAGAAVLYFAVPAALLRWNLDRLIFSAQSNDRTHEDKRFDVVVSPEAMIVVRRYGDEGRACASAALLFEQIPSVPVSVFQGTADTVTPYALARSATLGHSNVTFATVDGGTHQDTYQLAGAAYAGSLRLLLDADTSRSR